VKVLSVTKEVEEKALDLFEKYDDKTFSFTDSIHHTISDPILALRLTGGLPLQLSAGTIACFVWPQSNGRCS